MLRLIRILCLGGIILSALSLYEHLSSRAGLAGLSLCKIGQSFDCAAVAHSRWSEILGLPLASWGLLFYISLFLFGILASSESLVSRITASSVYVLMSLCASLFSIFLLSVSYLEIGKFCPLCLGMYAVNFLLLSVSWKFSQPLSLLKSLSIGLGKVTSTLLLALGVPVKGIAQAAEVAALARCGIAVLGVLLFTVNAASDYVSARVLQPQAQRSQALATWRSQPDETVPLSSGGALAGDYSWDKPDAKIQIVEFSDLECPACRAAYISLKPLLQQYKDDINFVFKNFPLDDSCNSAITTKFHQHACYAANVARCAGEQGKFWEAIDYLSRLSVYDRSEEFALIRAEIDKVSPHLGLDSQAVKDCLSSGRQMKKIQQDISEGNQLTIAGTPAFWINGKRFVAGSLEDFRAVFEEILAR